MPHGIRYRDGVLLTSLPSAVVEARYTLTDAAGAELVEVAGTEVAVPLLGSGGFGVVVRGKDRLGLPRALKFLDPDKFAEIFDGIPDGDGDTTGVARTLSATLQAEIRLTNEKPFKHVLPVTDYGHVVDQSNREVPYVVSPFVPGAPLDDFLNRKLDAYTFSELVSNHSARNNLHDLLLWLVDDLFGGLAELDEAQVSHLDIKPSNLLILEASGGRADGQFSRDRLFVIDLGGAISRITANPDRRVPVIRTLYFFPEEANVLMKSTPGWCLHSQLALWGPRIDLYSAGRTLELLLLNRVSRGSPGIKNPYALKAQEEAKEAKWRLVLGDDFALISGLIDKLLNLGDRGFRSAEEAREAFSTIARDGSSGVLASRVLTDRTRGTLIVVGNHSVRVAPPFDRVVDHPRFQRLKSLQQLAYVSEIFPEATHTRFAHVLRVFDLAKRVLMSLNRESAFRLVFNKRDAEQVLAAALLHDLGQYPFSHTIEDLRKLGDIRHIPELAAVRHDQEVASEYLDDASEGESIRSILVDAGYNVDEIVELFQKTKKENNKRPSLSVGRDIVSGLIDVDRISYLTHDSERTGLPYGKAVDVESLIDGLCLKPDEANGWSLAVDETAVSAVEALLAGVYWMYRNVYWRAGNRAFMAAVKHVMHTLLMRGSMSFRNYIEAVGNSTDYAALSLLHKRYQQLAPDLNFYDPLASLMTRRRLSLVRVFSLGLKIKAKGAVPGENDLYTRIMLWVGPELDAAVIAALTDLLPGAARPRAGEILIDVPLKKRLRDLLAGASAEPTETIQEAGAKPNLWVRIGNRPERARNPWVELHECSPFAAAIGSFEDISARKVRVFMSRELLQRIDMDPEVLAGAIERSFVKAVNELDLKKAAATKKAGSS